MLCHHLIDEQGNTKKIQLTKPSVFAIPHRECIVIPFDSQLWAYGEAATLLSSACGCIAMDSKTIPINFDSWSNVPKSYKDGCFNMVKVYAYTKLFSHVLFNYDLLTFLFCLFQESISFPSTKISRWALLFSLHVKKV